MMNIDKLREAWLQDNPKIFCFSNIFNFVQFCWAHKFNAEPHRVEYSYDDRVVNNQIDWREEDKKDGTPGIRTIFEGIKSSEVFTVVFKKQDKAKTKKQFESKRESQRAEAIALIDKAKRQKKSMATAYKEALEFIQNNPVKDYIEGEDRVLRGYKMQFVSRDGKYKYDFTSYL